jgi:sec-independent protein translocase protein TatA
MSIGPIELVVVLAIVLLLFGARRVPMLGRHLGRGARVVKDAVTAHLDRTGSTSSHESSGPGPTGRRR